MRASVTFSAVIFLSVILVSYSDADESLSSDEQESVYRVLEAINSDVDWRSLYPDDLCISGPHGIVCDYFHGRLHVTELNLGYVSDYSSNPSCSSNSSFSPRIASFPFLRKLLFYRCFTGERVVLPGYLWNLNSSSLEELYLLDNPSLEGVVSGRIGCFTRLRRIVLSGSRIGGILPESVGNLSRLEQLVMTRNRFSGEVPRNIGMLKNLKILDLSYNRLTGFLPEDVGLLSHLLKLDLSFNRIEGEVPNSLVGLQILEFVDLSYNRFSNSGIPLFLADMPRLREVYLSGNPLGGQIPEIWEKLGGVLGLGLSGLGLVGCIPRSMGLFLRNVCYLGLDNNMLEGTVPFELELLESLKEMNLENNRLSGKISLPVKFHAKVKLGGNHDLCVDSSKSGVVLGSLKVCRKPVTPDAMAVLSRGSSSELSLALFSFLCLFSLLAF
ncbi:piriformospora indica-insensitive protein 2 [Aristolochia californica]|uniref:piriformospora indica-insensitive protein 2 n=1 Tax=Aristolochia californica TaxID=171875 RepID=UPI0035E157FC